jgi:heat shock protein HtpX
MSDKPVYYNIETEIPSTYKEKLLDYIQRKYVLAAPTQFSDVSRTTADGHPLLAFDVADSTMKQKLHVEIKAGEPIDVQIAKLDAEASERWVNEVREDIMLLVDFFEEEVRMSTLYFAWREGEKIVPEEHFGRERKTINRMFLETQVLLFVVFITLGLFLFEFLGWIAPIVLLGIQLIIIFYSNKIIERTADWHITEQNPTIHLLEYRLPLEAHESFRQTYTKDQIVQMKKEMYDLAMSKKGEIDCEAAQKVLGKFGFDCRPENLVTKKVNVYQLVKKVVDKFGFPTPEIVVSNTLMPNAAASGISPRRGVVLITTGLLVQLDEQEIVSVLGHEFGHLKGRDPLLLYGLTGAEFLFRFYVLLPFLPIFSESFLPFLLYFWAVMTFIFFIAKFFEARADLVSAMVIGQPKTLARSLEKIGFKRLLIERLPLSRLQEWISLDPHPPIYFRVQRLEKLEEPVQVKHPLLKSAKEVIAGFLASFKR